MKYAYLIVWIFSLYRQSIREEWASPASCVHTINSSEFSSFLNLENSLSNLMARVLSFLTFCTQSLHWWNSSTNANAKQSKAVNSSFSRVFNRIALAKAASSFIKLDEILSRTEISSLTVKLLVDCQMEGDASSKLRINLKFFFVRSDSHFRGQLHVMSWPG